MGFDKGITILDGSLIRVSDDRFPHYKKNWVRTMNACEKRLDEHNIGTILCVTCDSKAGVHEIELYDEMELKYVERLINDELDNHLPNDFLDKCVEVYREQHKKDKNMLIHCSAGVNRSFSAAGAIIWVFYPEPRPWKTPEGMIEWMADCQKRDRKEVILTNPNFRADLIEWCLKHDSK